MLTDSVAIDRVTSGKLARGALAAGGMRGEPCCSDCAEHAGLGDITSITGLRDMAKTWIGPTVAIAGVLGALWLAWPKAKRRRRPSYSGERRTARLPAETMSQVVWERR
jgi:hypothetical protein